MESHESRFSSRSPTWIARPKYLSHFWLPFQEYKQGAGSEAEKMELTRRVPSMLTCCTPTQAPMHIVVVILSICVDILSLLIIGYFALIVSSFYWGKVLYCLIFFTLVMCLGGVDSRMGKITAATMRQSQAVLKHRGVDKVILQWRSVF